jgi:hypothetical protein
MPKARNAVIELGGPEALSPLEVVRIFEELQGRKFDVEHVPEEALSSSEKTASDPLQQSFAGLMLYYSRGDIIEHAGTTGQVFRTTQLGQRFRSTVVVIGLRGC